MRRSRVEINLLSPRPLFDMEDPTSETLRAIALPLHFRVTPPWIRMVPVYGFIDRFRDAKRPRPEWWRVTPRKAVSLDDGVSKVVTLPGADFRR